MTGTMIESAWPSHPDYRIDLVPCRGTARVTVGDRVVAESKQALRLIETDHVERLYFPEADVRLDLLTVNDHHTVCPFKGQASYRSHPDVEDLFWTYPDPFPEVAGIQGHFGVYHERARVEVDSSWPDGATAVNAFPYWGDLDDLLVLLDPQPAGDGRFTLPGYHELSRNVVEGGQLMGQAVMAAARAVPDQRVTWASMTFARPARFDSSIEVTVDAARRGRTFSSLATRTEQDGKLVGPGLVLMDAGASDLMRHTADRPDVPGPDRSEPYDMAVAGRDLRVVDGAYGDSSDQVGPPVIYVWVRYRENPQELAMRQALIAQLSTHWAIAAAMRPHPGIGQSQAHRTLSTGPVAASLAFHDDAPLDEWLLYSNTATWSGLGLIHGEGRIYSQSGALVASYAQQAMVRTMMASAEGRDASSVM